MSKCSIHGLRTFKYKNTFELCANTQDKYKMGKIIVNECFSLHKEVIGVLVTNLHSRNRKNIIIS